MKDFEGAKRDFGKSDDATMYWELTANMRGAVDSQYYDEDDGIVNLYAADLKQMFDPVIKKITALLQSQLDAERRQAGHVSIKVTHGILGAIRLMLTWHHRRFSWLVASESRLTSTTSYVPGARSAAYVCFVLSIRKSSSIAARARLLKKFVVNQLSFVARHSAVFITFNPPPVARASTTAGHSTRPSTRCVITQTMASSGRGMIHTELVAT